MTTFKAHKISALCWSFVSRNFVIFPWVIGTLFDSLCVCPASWLDDVAGSSGFSCTTQSRCSLIVSSKENDSLNLSEIGSQQSDVSFLKHDSLLQFLPC